MYIQLSYDAVKSIVKAKTIVKSKDWAAIDNKDRIKLNNAHQPMVDFLRLCEFSDNFSSTFPILVDNQRAFIAILKTMQEKS